MAADTGLPPNWEIRHSKTKGIPYYYNNKTSESRWEPPTDADSAKLSAYMALNHSIPLVQPAPPPDQDKIRTSHLLVKHAESRRPSSWRSATISRSKTEAMQIILQHEARIRAGEISLGELAVSESDCSSARKGGDLGYFGRGEMQKEFEEAAFGLQVGEMSRVVETASGLHLIERTG
ncbi:hypothetical protein G7K_5058-t1 [Saitoella complicata NRRL Y-17804]|uniref:Peptidyl-prolyl cis-trans isomerase n=1 Tax=Saitoella complicata (strain BCRC 22490 / CBS 7301 / JCM 7358 / NBRC 10748 / NRRL Y-17804) TaxID=698492 RepID=A0A0E9NM77_SAICN|nr:hypothetical protein G7K_5058-t1 [Saitoella complicata NRRL Y-17804]